MYHSRSQPRHDSMMSLSPSSSYQGSPSNACTTPTQPLQSPMMATTRPWQPAQSVQSVQHQLQPQLQLQQPLQQQVHTFSNGHNLQPRTYQPMMPLQQQHIREMQQVQSTQTHAHMMQQMQGQQWMQQSLQQQQIQPKSHLSYQTANTRQLVAADRYGNQWTQEQYREMLRRRQRQMAQLSAAVSPGLQPQMQHVPQASPSRTVSQRPTNNASRPLTPWPHAELLQHQQMNIRSPQTLSHPRSQEQPQPALPVMTNCPQQPLLPIPSDFRLAQKHLAEIIRLRQAPKSLLSPSKSSNGAKVPVSAKPTTQPAAHKQGVRKSQKQPRHQPAPSPALPKTPEVTQTIQQTNTAQVKAISDSVTPKSCNSTMTPPIRKSDMPPPSAPSGPRKCPSTRASTSASPRATPSRHTPSPSTTASTCKNTIDIAEVEQDTSLEDILSIFLSDCYEYTSEESSIQNNVPEGSSSSHNTPQPSTITSTTHASTPTPPSTTAPSLPMPASPSPPRSPSPENILANCTFSPFTTYQEIREGAYPGFEDYHDPHAVVQEEQDPSRAPEERSMSEERARLEWEMMVTEGRYAGVPTEEGE